MNVEEIETTEDLDALIAAAEARKVAVREAALKSLQEDVEAVKAKCESLGINPLTFFGVDVTPERDKSKPLYANPSNPQETYSRGKYPQWLKDRLAGLDDEQKKAVLDQCRAAV